MCLINKVYTAQDMRDAAKCLFSCQVDLKHDNRDISRMLRQAADMMDRADGEAAAYKRLAIPTPEQWTEIARQGAEIADLKRENASLRAALKSAMEKDVGK